MPPVIAGAVVAGAAAAATALPWLAGAAFLQAFGTSLVLGGLSYALTPKPKKPSFAQQVTSNTFALRQSDITRKIVYGHTRISAGYAHMESTGANGKLHAILMLCDGELESIDEIWVNDYVIPSDWIDSDGNVTQGRYAGKLVIRKHLGSVNQSADLLAVTNMQEWTPDHRLQGIAYIYLILTKDQDVYPTGVPNFSAVVRGGRLYDPRVDDMVWSTSIPLFFRDYITRMDYGFGASTEDINDTNISTEANIADEIVTVAADDIDMVSVDTSTDIMTLTGDRLKFLYGDRVEVVTSGTPPSGLSTGTSYYVIPYQIKDTPRIQFAASFDDAMAGDFIDISSSGSGTITIRKTGEPRYHGSGIIETESDLGENIDNLLNSMAGRAFNTGGAWTLQVGAWRSPNIELGVSDVRAPISFKSNISMSERFNIVKGLFISPLSDYQPTDFPMIQYQTFITQDLAEYPRDISLPFTNRPTTAQRIGKIELFRARQEIAFTTSFSMKALQLQCGDTVEITLDRYGWSQKEFEVTQLGIDIRGEAMMVRLGLRETAQAIYDWSQGEAIVFDPAPNTSLPNPFDVQVPTGVGYNSRSVETAQGDEVFILALQWDEHPDAFVLNRGDFEIQYKLSSSANWLPSFFVDGSLTSTDVLTGSVNTSYDLRIRARNNLLVRSNWSTITGAIVGTSGGVVNSQDWGSVADAPTGSQDWGFVYDAPTGTQDWGYV